MNQPSIRDDGRPPPPVSASHVPRRRMLAGLAAGLALRALPATAHGAIGPVKPPARVPEIIVLSSDGSRGPLHARLLGQVTAVQLMFTTCRSICPIEAATFVRTQQALARFPANGIQLLSLSIDPATDTPDVLRAWLDNLGAGPGWTAASPASADLARARQFFDGASSLGEDHSTAMSLIDQSGRLVWRTAELPAADDVARMLSQLQQAPRAGL